MLNIAVLKWAESYDHEHRHFILYYAGHGRISDPGRTVAWYKYVVEFPPVVPEKPTRILHSRFQQDDLYQELEWAGCEEVLLEAASDQLFIFDCCYAAGAISTGFRGVSETICVTGFESIAPRPGRTRSRRPCHSFSGDGSISTPVFCLRSLLSSSDLPERAGPDSNRHRRIPHCQCGDHATMPS